MKNIRVIQVAEHAPKNTIRDDTTSPDDPSKERRTNKIKIKIKYIPIKPLLFENEQTK
jgi:hypothetical protein